MTIASSHRVPPANSPRSEPPVERAGSASHDQGSRQVSPSASTARRATAVRSSCPSPSRASSTGVPSDSAYVVISAATAGSGGLDTSTMSPVDGSAASSASAARVDRPPTLAERSRPPTPRQWLTPTPLLSSMHISCWAPVPLAATMPTGPGRTALANPSPTPPTTAVPQSGPITSRPRRAASSLSRTSASTGTLSLKTSTDRPAPRASIVSVKACGPGTETRARSAPPVRRAADATVRGAGSPPPRPAPPAAPAELAASAASRAARAAATVSGSAARSATTRSLGPVPAGGAKPAPRIRSRLSSVPIATCAAETPSTRVTSRLTCIRVTESW